MKHFILAAALLAMAGLTDISAGNIRGTVKSGKLNLEGVIVTDGENFTATDRKGRFKLDVSESADFVYIVTPSGYVADYEGGQPVFYLPADHEGSFDFELVPAENSGNYSIIAFADPQTAHEKHFAKFRKKVIPELRESAEALKNESFTVGIVLGDICWDALDLLDSYKEEMASLGIPVYPVIGNHDHDKDSKGDHVTSSVYREKLGPENYAFGIGDDYVIVLDNVIYNTQKNYVEGYTEEQVEWVEGLLEYIPETSHIYIAQHCPFMHWHNGGRYTFNGEKLLEVLDGYDVNFISGHTHINNNLMVTPEIMEFNVAASCGSWWITGHCTDGTPSGYKIFTKKDGELSWFYKSLGKPRDYQIEVFAPGQSMYHPNSVLVNVWDYDPEWSVTWYQDGRNMREMTKTIEYSPEYIREISRAYTFKGKEIPAYKNPRPNGHYFIAEPSQYASKVTVVVKDRFGNEYREDIDMHSYVDVQAHRGGAGLMPENTVEAMKNAIDMGVNTLEMDLQISADGQVVVSHDAYFHPRYATRPDGTVVEPDDPKEYIYTMPYSEVKKYDTGMRPSTVWPEKACIPAYKPLASELIGFVENYTKENGLSPMRYNIEIKSKTGKTEGKNWPEYHEFVDKCIELLLSMNLGDRLVVQSFDVRALNYMHEKYPELILSYLVDEDDTDFEKYMSLLNFTPQWLSPHFSTTDDELCSKVHDKGMKIVPWTVDRAEDISRMIELGVDAIISNYPDRVLMQTRGYFDFPSWNK